MLGNPLLKYDGYHILSDWLEIPNFRQQASDAAWNVFLQWLNGKTPVDAAQHYSVCNSRSVWLLMAHACTSFVYRIAMIAGIVFGLWHMLHPLGLEILAYILATSCVAGLAWSMMSRFRRTMLGGRYNSSPVLRYGVVGVLGILAAVAVLLLPIPQWIEGPLIIEAQDAQPVYVEVSGRLPVHDPDTNQPGLGQAVRRGDVLVELKNFTLEKERLILESQVAAARLQSQSLASIRARVDSASGQLESAREP